jgi:hypothetical protein
MHLWKSIRTLCGPYLGAPLEEHSDVQVEFEILTYGRGTDFLRPPLAKSFQDTLGETYRLLDRFGYPPL